MCNKSIICGVLFASGAITFYEGNNILSALAKYVINRLIHVLFHIALVISPRLISSLGLKPSRLISRSRADNKGNMKKAMY
jgi:Na+/H+-dicarboxylate symporter